MTDAGCVVADEAVESTEGDGEGAADGADAVDTSHLDDMADGCGCAEVWEHLSERRDEARTESRAESHRD